MHGILIFIAQRSTKKKLKKPKTKNQLPTTYDLFFILFYFSQLACYKQ